MEVLKQYYTNIFSATYSTCGYYLVAGNSYGYVAIFNLSPFIEKDELDQFEASQKYPFYKFKAHERHTYSIGSSKHLVVSGSVGELKVWKWSDIKKQDAKVVWVFTIPQGDSLVKPEVNSIVINKFENESYVFAGCGDGNIYCLDVPTKACLFVLRGHTDGVNCLYLNNNNQECTSGSEDGSVRLWDVRKGETEALKLEPYKHSLVNRPEQGKWIGCASFDSSDDWLVCGGAPSLSVWHLKSMAPCTKMEKEGVVTNTALFYDDTVISGGSEPFVNHWSLDGKLNVQVPTSASNILSIGTCSSLSHQILAAAGSSYKIDLCTDFRYKDLSLYFCDIPS